MKYLLLLALLAGFFFFMGAKRGRPRDSDETPPPPPAPPKAMLRCAQCGMHLPADDALPGRGGVFCSAEHRTRFESQPGGPA